MKLTKRKFEVEFNLGIGFGEVRSKYFRSLEAARKFGKKLDVGYSIYSVYKEVREVRTEMSK